MKYKLFKKQIESLIPDVKRFAFSLTRDLENGDDLTQQALVISLSKHDQFKDHSKLKNWIFRIVYTTWIDINRKNKTIRNYKNMIQGNEQQNDTTQDNMRALNTCIDYKKLLGLLDEKHKACFHLICVEGYSYNEVSEILGIPVGTVASRISHSRRKFNQYFSGLRE